MIISQYILCQCFRTRNYCRYSVLFIMIMNHDHYYHHDHDHDVDKKMAAEDDKDIEKG